jgi:NADP-dependent 3-hydroxy acid dehydrogenase YdfG
MPALTDQVAVVTGASSGVGKAIALELAAQGAALCLVGRKLHTLAAVAESVQGTTRWARCYQVDLTRDEGIQELVVRLQRDVRYVDLLIHSAGVISQGQLEDAPIEDLDWQYRTNVRAPYVLTQALLPMLKSRQGQIVFINSSTGLSAKANVGQYAATKHALKAVADSLRDEVNADGLRVLSVFLGRTATPMQAAVHEMEQKAYHPERLIQPQDVAAVVVNALSLPRSAEVTDVSIRPLLKPT